MIAPVETLGEKVEHTPIGPSIDEVSGNIPIVDEEPIDTEASKYMT